MRETEKISFGVYPRMPRIICFHKSAEHLLWRFAGRDILQEIREEVFSQHFIQPGLHEVISGRGPPSLILFRSSLPSSIIVQVSSEVRIHDFVKAKPPEGCNKFPGENLTRLEQPSSLADTDSVAGAV